VLAPGQDPLDPNFSAHALYFGQSAARIYLGDFEQYVKFAIKQFVTKTNSLNNVDLTNLTILIGFEDSSGKVFTYPALPSTIQSPFSEGEVVFKISADTRKRIGLDGTQVKSFYILTETATSGQTKLYVGTVDSDINMHAENERVKTLGSQALTINTLTSAGTGVTGTGTIPQDLGVVSNNDSLVSQLSQMANSSVTQSEYSQFGDGNGFGEFLPGINQFGKNYPTIFSPYQNEHNNKLPFLT
jgi:hypothetical protein